MLVCPFHWLTGLNCPLCGAQRMILALAHGNVAEAFWLNPGLFVGLPLLALWWWRRGLSSKAALVALSIFVVWGIVRNFCLFHYV